jgi:hypothetical protein
MFYHEDKYHYEGPVSASAGKHIHIAGKSGSVNQLSYSVIGGKNAKGK